MQDGIKAISVRNYQSLRKIDLDLGRITAIVGESDSGKSALFRAVRAWAINQDGTDFITAGEKKTSVTIDGVSWIQAKDINRYEIGDKVWDKVGRSVPDEVRAATNMGEFEFGKDIRLCLNFSAQLDPLFVVQGNPADNAKVIGSISNIHRIYNAIREAEKDAKACKRGLGEVQTRSEQLKTDIDSEAGKLEMLDRRVAAIKAIFVRAEAIDNRMLGITAVWASITRAREAMASARGVVARYKGIDFGSAEAKIVNHINIDAIGTKYAIMAAQYITTKDTVSRYRGVKFQAIEAKMVNYSDIATMGARIAGLDAQYTAARRAVAAFKGFRAQEGMDATTRYENLSTTRSALLSVLQEIKAMRKQRDTSAEAMAAAQAELDTIEVCPQCGAQKKHWKA
jgi:energy-coupling factor transporter ATP-binding protein EcfA2